MGYFYLETKKSETGNKLLQGCSIIAQYTIIIYDNDYIM